MYAASIMFGYFLRKADKRFSLDRAMGTLPLNPEESARSLEALFESASAMDSVDAADLGIEGDARGRPSASERSDASEGKLTLKQYIQSFDAATLAETARVVSLEGVVLAERQTGALFGSVETLAREMQSALEEGGEPITSPEELMRRVEDVVGGGKVATVTLPVATQRRVVLEAVAFGSFLRDAEAFVDARDGRLLTPARDGVGRRGCWAGGRDQTGARACRRRHTTRGGTRETRAPARERESTPSRVGEYVVRLSVETEREVFEFLSALQFFAEQPFFHLDTAHPVIENVPFAIRWSTTPR